MNPVHEEWLEWDKPITILSLHAQEIHIPDEILRVRKQGCFRFDDGTTQNWKLDQLYDADSFKKINPYSGFTLGNSQYLALAATASPLLFYDTAVELCEIYLESPDLLLDANWQNISGYSIDLQRGITSLCGESHNPTYFAQLQIRLVDSEDDSEYLYGEWDARTDKHIFNPVKLNQPYHFTFKPTVLSDPKWKVKQLRVRLVMPNVNKGFGAGECALKGSWLIGNVCPE